jgi:predicted Zn-dependent protease
MCILVTLSCFLANGLLCVPTPNALALTIEEEHKLGQEFLTQIRAHFVLIQDEFPRQFINDLGQYLTQQLEIRHFPYRFYLIKDNSLNAFAAPGGHIFVFSGLVEIMSAADELAAVITHEIAHVSARHLSKRIELSRKITLATLAGILAGVLIGGKAAAALITGSMAAGIQAQLHYSRNDERQADQLGYRYLKPTGFNPAALLTTMKEIERGRWFGSDKIPPYLLTHPTGPERMATLETMLRGFQPKSPTPEVVRFRSRFPYFRAYLMAKSLESYEAERLFKLDLKKDSDSTVPLFGLGVVHKERGEYELAIDYLKRALKSKPDFIPLLTTLGECYQLNGQDAEAIQLFRRALNLDEGNKGAMYLLGLSYENRGQYGKAVGLFEILTAFKPVRNEVYYHLGVSYGKAKRLARAHYNFWIYFKRLGQVEKARFHFQKAEGLSTNDPLLRKKIEKAKGKPR